MRRVVEDLFDISISSSMRDKGILTLMVEFERVRHKRKPHSSPSSTSTTSKLVIRSSEFGSSFGQTAARMVAIPNEGIHRTLQTKNSSQAALVNRYFPHFDHEVS